METGNINNFLKEFSCKKDGGQYTEGGSREKVFASLCFRIGKMFDYGKVPVKTENLMMLVHFSSNRRKDIGCSIQGESLC